MAQKPILSFGYFFILIFCFPSTSFSARVTGALKKWHPVTIDFIGPHAGETDSSPNPFLDYRLQVTLKGPSGKTYNVPGFFDGNGDGGGTGNIFRVRFTPDETGKWTYQVSFRKGENVAIYLSPNAGAPTDFDGKKGTFFISKGDSNAPGFLKWGRLEYVRNHYLKFRDGPYWIKGGADSPENFLGYNGFDNTPAAKHNYAPHIPHWNQGDPDWGNGKGKGIIGSLNYLASKKVNSIYFLPMNIGGDYKDTWPFIGPIIPEGSAANNKLHYDISKLRQWEMVFAHAEKKGIMLHFVLNEAETANKMELDSAKLGVERKLFYRELIARFGHHLALQWNICEEFNSRWKGSLELLPKTIKEWAAYIRAMDPYHHPITVHHASKVFDAWASFIGDPLFEVTSFQTQDIWAIQNFRKKSSAVGLPLVISVDETWPEPASDSNAATIRKKYIGPVYFSGGNLELILKGYMEKGNFKDYESLWDDMWHMRQFFENHLPYWEMEPNDGLLSNHKGSGKVFTKPGEYYAVYLPKGGSGKLDLSTATGYFEISWFNPRTGKFEGKTEVQKGGGPIALGYAPTSPVEDWVVFIKKRGLVLSKDYSGLTLNLNESAK